MKKNSMRTNKIVGDILVHAILSILALIILFPIIYSIAGSFKPLDEIFADADNVFPKHATIKNYIDVISSREIQLGRMAWNSFYYTVATVAAMMLASTLNAYVFERGDFPFKKTIFVVFSSLMFISMGSITIYPLFDILNVIHLNKSLWGLIVIKALGIPIVNIVLVKSYIHTLPKELDEAAEIDGCSFYGIFWRIIFPLLTPIMATIGILGFNASWNEYLMPAIFTLSNKSQQTLMVGITAMKTSGESASNWTLMLAAANLSLIPTLLACLFGNKYFISGLSAGALKG